MPIEVIHTKAPKGSREYDAHYRSELLRLDAQLPTTPIRMRSELAHRVDQVLMLLGP